MPSEKKDIFIEDQQSSDEDSFDFSSSEEGTWEPEEKILFSDDEDLSFHPNNDSENQASMPREKELECSSSEQDLLIQVTE